MLGLRHILTNGTITNEITINNLLTNNLNNNVLPNTNTTDITTALDNYLNPLEKKDATKSRINKLKNINQYNLKDFFEFKKLINEMNKRFPDWYTVPSWYNNTTYAEAIKQSICFNRSTDINLILENISTVLNGLKGLFGTTQLRKKLEYVTTRDIYELISTFHVYFNKQYYSYNSQLELLYPIFYALECKKLYNCNDFVNKIGNKLALDVEIHEGVKKLFKRLDKRKLI